MWFFTICDLLIIIASVIFKNKGSTFICNLSIHVYVLINLKLKMWFFRYARVILSCYCKHNKIISYNRYTLFCCVAANTVTQFPITDICYLLRCCKYENIMCTVIWKSTLVSSIALNAHYIWQNEWPLKKCTSFMRLL